MTISDAQYAAWLDDPTAQRVTLYRFGCVSGGVQTTRYLSNQPYIGSAATPYLAYIAKDLEITESISMDGEAKLSSGEVEVHNIGGELDSWLGDIFANQSATVLIGDVRWAEVDFRPQYVGVLADIAPGSDRNRLTFKFRDILQNLNTPVSEDKLTGDILRPIVFGEVANVTPKVKNAATGEYEVHAGIIEDVIEARVDGKPRSAITKNLSVGSFTFNTAVGPGTVTCSVQGDKGDQNFYVHTVADVIQRMVTGYGKASTRLSVSDLDMTNFDAFNAANPQPIGLALADRTNVLAACSQVASSKGAQVIPSRLGKVRLIQYAIPSSATLDLPRSMQIQRSLALTARTSAQAAVKVGYCKNYTVEASLQTSLPPDHKQMFATEWQTYTATDAATQAAYKLYTDPVQIDTCLLTTADAQAEANRRLAIVKVPRKTFRVELLPAGLLVQLGEARNLFSDRFGLAAGVPGLVTSLSVNFGTYRTIAEVTV